jgi:hypothetical protein
MKGLEVSAAAAPNIWPSVGDKAQSIAASTCGRCEIRRAVIATFAVQAIVNATNRRAFTNTFTVARSAHFQIIIGAGKGV